MRRKLRGKRILLTGASRGIGRHLALRLARCGARLALAARSTDELNKVARELTFAGTDAYAIPTDLTQAASRDALVQTAVEKLGGLDVLINNAGIASFGHFDTSDESILRQIMELNFFAPAEMMRLCITHLVRGAQPAIVNVASVCGRVGIPAWPEHCAAKHALVGLSEAVRAEFVRFGIDVLVAMPGMTQSDDLGKHLLRNAGRHSLNYRNAPTPKLVANGIVQVLQWNRHEACVGRQSRWLVWASRLFPRVVDYFLQRAVRQLYGQK
jgi:short-subunit dehydrogenase